MSFVAPDVDVVLKPLIQSFKTSGSYHQSNQHPVFLHRFPSQGFRGFSPPADNFSPIDRVFSPIKPPVFLLRFFIDFRRFFHQSNIHGFLLSFPLGLGGFFLQCHDLKCLYARWGSRLREKAIVMS